MIARGCRFSWEASLHYGLKAAFLLKTAERTCPALGPPRAEHAKPMGRSASASRRAGYRRVHVGGVDDSGSGQDRFRREVETILNIAMKQRHREIALQIGLLVDRKQLLAILDPLQAGFVHVEGSELDLGADPGLSDCIGGTVCIA